MRAASLADYPIGLETTPLLGEDRFFYHKRLLEDSSRLFKKENDIEVLLSHEKEGCKWLSSPPGFCSILDLTDFSKLPNLSDLGTSQLFIASWRREYWENPLLGIS